MKYADNLFARRDPPNALREAAAAPSPHHPTHPPTTAVPGGDRVAANQVLYNLAHRGVEFDLLPWCAARRIAVMAYSPLDEGRLVRHPALDSVAKRLHASAGQVAVAWLLRNPDVVTIPKAATPEHVRANRAAADLALDDGALDTLERAFPAPRRKRPLEVI